MITARDVMHTGVSCIGEHETVSTAAKHMRDLDVGALPICRDERLLGMVTDRDLVTKCIAAGHDPKSTTVGELARGGVYHVDADASIADMLTIMEAHQIRRLPVVEGHRLLGIVSEADIARRLPEHAIADFVKAICAPAGSGSQPSLTAGADTGA